MDIFNLPGIGAYITFEYPPEELPPFDDPLKKSRFTYSVCEFVIT